MLGNMLQAVDKIEALRSTSWAAGANNGPWIDVSKYEGELSFLYNIGAVTGSGIFKLQDADDTGGTNSADVAGAASASLSTPGTTAALIVRSDAVRKAVRLVFTVTTGPILGAGIMNGHPKYI